MAKSAKTAQTAVLQASEIQSMQQEQRIATFVSHDNVMRRAFSELGKLLTFIARNIARDTTVEKVLAAAGVHRSTVSNAKLAKTAFDLVEAGVITESKYDTLTFEECRAIGKVKSMDTLKSILTAKNYREELSSVIDNGCTLAEHKQREADKAALIDKAKEPTSETTTATTAATPAESGKKSGKADKAGKAPENVVPGNFQAAAADVTQADLMAAAMSYVKGLQDVLPRLTDATPVMDALRAMVEGKPAKVKKAA